MSADRTTHIGHGLTVGQVEDLKQEALRAGDEAMVQICLDALECDRTALAECARVIADAKAQADEPQPAYDADGNPLGWDVYPSDVAKRQS